MVILQTVICENQEILSDAAVMGNEKPHKPTDYSERLLKAKRRLFSGKLAVKTILGHFIWANSPRPYRLTNIEVYIIMRIV